MSEGVTYRMAGLDDIDLLRKTEDQLFDNEIKLACAEEFFNDPRHHMALALVQEKVIAMASAFHYIHPDKEAMLFINEVAVLEEFQNKGVGRNLVSYLCQYGASLGLKEAWIATHVNNTAARIAFAAAGGREDSDLAVVFNYELEVK